VTRFAAGVASIVLLAAVGAGLGTYFATRHAETSLPPVPKAYRNPVLEAATSRGIISGYRLDELRPGSSLRYAIAGGGVSLVYFGCVGDASCPARETIVQVEYRHSAVDLAHAILRIARAQMPGSSIKFFEFSQLGRDPVGQS
jgi:hypothetical protein